jgi:hypothetical protein
MKQLFRIVAISAIPAFFILDFHRNGGPYYLDAATGSLIIQALIGGAVAVLIAIRIFWTRIKTSIRNLLGGSKKGEEPPE